MELAHEASRDVTLSNCGKGRNNKAHTHLTHTFFYIDCRSRLELKSSVFRQTPDRKEAADMNSKCTLSALLALLITAATLQGQETGSIAGQVLDPAGAAVALAAVTIRNEATAASFSAVSDQTGFYRV